MRQEPTPAVAEALRLRALAALQADEPEREPPPYPYPDPRPNDLERRYAERRMTAAIKSGTLDDALRVIRDQGLPVVAEDPALAEAQIGRAHGAQPRGAPARDVLDALALYVGGVVDYEGSIARVVRALQPAALERRRRQAALYGGAPFDRAGDLANWRSQYRRFLSERRLRLDFAGATLGDAIGFLRDATGLNFVIRPEVDGSAAVSVEVKEQPWPTLGEAIGRILAAAGGDLGFRLLDDAIVIGRERDFETPAFDGLRVKVGLLGAAVPDLCRALEAEGVPVLVSPESWACRGTFSLWSDELPLGRLASGVAAHTPLRAEIASLSEDPPRDVLVIRGEVPSARRALEAPPSPWRDSLADLILERAQARRRSPLDREEVYRLERDVARAAAEVPGQPSLR